jgi:hypothetical protein
MRALRTICFALLCLSLSGAAPAGAQSFQEGVTRKGPSFLTVTAPSATRCQAACLGDGHCRAWNYVESDNIENCQLMSQRPAPKKDPCCYSGEVSE